jgi:hypothetical protein
MKLRAFVIAFFVSAWFGCQCGPVNTDPCAAVKCGAGLTCDPLTGRCSFPIGVGGGTGTTGGGGGSTSDDGGQQMGTCTPACGGATPICDAATNTCKTCTATQGCSGATPVCQTIANGGQGKCVVCTVGNGCSDPTPACDPTVFPSGACVQCVQADDCPVPGSLCDLDTHTCVAGGMGGGAGGGGGTTTGGGTGSTAPPLWFNDAGMTARCLPFDAGTMTCTNECPKGYECLSGICRLRGSTGPIQITLRWNQPQDLDLYVVEPLPDGGSCEIYYGRPGINPTPPPIPLPFPIPQSSCGAKGWLDLDSNRACTIDNIDVENVIYDAGLAPTRGTYEVRANYWQNCTGAATTPYEVEVRANGVTRWFCGTFNSNDANGGNSGAGVVITRFTIP